MKRILMITAAMVMGLMSAPAMAANPCNPCNPCAMKKNVNPCNPCSMKQSANPCNPCGMKKPAAGQWGTPGNTAIRPHAFDNFQQAVDLGRRMWNDDKLGTSGLSCLSCHGDHALLNLDRNRNFPHFVKMVGDVVTLDQMINYCMLNPMKGKPFARDSKELTAMAAYYRAYRIQYLREHRHP